jgi:hypothetical protein
LGKSPRQRSKVFWFFFSKKNCFLPLYSLAAYEVAQDDATLRTKSEQMVNKPLRRGCAFVPIHDKHDKHDKTAEHDGSETIRIDSPHVL